jgi:hypothetical protein
VREKSKQEKGGEDKDINKIRTKKENGKGLKECRKKITRKKNM